VNVNEAFLGEVAPTRFKRKTSSTGPAISRLDWVIPIGPRTEGGGPRYAY